MQSASVNFDPGGRCATRSRWTFGKTALMILGFIIAWPLGLAMLAYILWGEEIRSQVTQWTEKGRAMFNRSVARPSPSSPTGNIAFDEYRDREIERLEAERRRLDAMRAEFDEYIFDLKRARDSEEFAKFMDKRSSAQEKPAS